jgi:beta-1,4-mannosyl-glycoprotein beta-1,4-N-acetylglucosaminyltransferase
MKIIDCFIFYNELELLQARMEELYDLVDYFILVEGKLTFTGKQKKLYYDENKFLFSKYNDKIIHLIADNYPSTNNPWDREFYQRRFIHNGIKNLSLDPHDLIIISDVDEIPNSDIIRKIKNHIIPIDINSIYSLVMTLYYYNVEWTTNRKWDYFVKLLSSKKYNDYNDPQKIRVSNYDIRIFNAGWHISYFGDINFIINKLESYSEQQTNTKEFKNSDFLNNCISQGILYFNSEQLVKNTNMENLPIYFKMKK